MYNPKYLVTISSHTLMLSHEQTFLAIPMQFWIHTHGSRMVPLQLISQFRISASIKFLVLHDITINHKLE